MFSLPLRLALVAAAASLALVPSAHAAVVFVNAAQAAPIASQDGTSWATAYQDLRTALTASPTGSEFWIATGTYRPTTTTDRTISFVVKANQKLLGGFLPGATSAEDRDPAAQPTILSGDIGVPGLADDNSHRVLFGQLVPGLVLDGLFIEDGKNEIDSTAGSGAGLRLISAAGSVIRDCVIRRCSGVFRGGAAAINGSDGAFLHRVTFEGNSAAFGGAFDLQNSEMTLVSCRFLGNRSSGSAGALATFGASGTTLLNCEFSGNVSLGRGPGFGGGAASLSPGVAIHSSTFANNSAASEGGALRTGGQPTTTTITNCLFVDNTAAKEPHIYFDQPATVAHCGFSDAPVAGLGNAIVTASLLDPLGPDGVAGTVDDDLRLTSGSEAIDRAAVSELPVDAADLDGDGDTAEPTPVDARGMSRQVNDPRPNEGVDASSFLDLGAHEFDRPTRIYFVDADVEDDGNGSSWEKAFRSLQSALLAFQSEPQSKPVEIWVAEGAYEPGTSREDRFAPQGTVTILGGFKGNEWRRSDRRPLSFPTILCGEIGSPATIDDNSLHVVHFAGDTVSAETILDGFVISGGNANGGDGDDNFGGGILVSGVARPTVRNCRIMANAAKSGGGGVAVTGTGSRIELVGCYLGGNAASNVGGAILITDGAAGSTIVHCTIAGNEAEVCGGLAAQGTGSSACVLNSAFAENFEEQGTSETEQVAMLSGGSLTLDHCAVPCGSTIAFGSNLVSLPPAFASLVGQDERYGTLDDDFTLSPSSPLIDAGVRGSICGAAVPDDVSDLDDDFDLDEKIAVDALGLPRVVDDPDRPNADPSLPLDIGAAERQTPSRVTIVLGDLDGSGGIDGADLAIMLGQWGGYAQAVDLNGDCVVDAADLALLLGGWTG